MNKDLFYILLLVIISSCIKSEYVKKELFENGLVKSKKYYRNKNDSIPYLILRYNKSGILVDSSHYNTEGVQHGINYHYNDKEKFAKKTLFKNGIKTGLATVKLENGYYITQHYDNNLLNGIQRVYDSTMELKSEFLWVNDTVVARKVINSYYPNDTIVISENINGKYVESYKLLQDSTNVVEYSITDNTSSSKFRPIGSLKLSNGKVDRTYPYNNYTNLILKDTITYGEVLKLQVKTYLPYGTEAVNQVIKLGDIDSKINFKGTIREIELEDGIMNYSIEVKKYKKGYNVLTGIVYYMDDSIVIGRSFLFEDFIVE